jgi:hypothetical protein
LRLWFVFGSLQRWLAVSLQVYTTSWVPLFFEYPGSSRQSLPLCDFSTYSPFDSCVQWSFAALEQVYSTTLPPLPALAASFAQAPLWRSSPPVNDQFWAAVLLHDQSTILVFLAELLAVSLTHFPSYPLMAVTGGGGAVDDDAMEILIELPVPFSPPATPTSQESGW